jgi:ribulose-phosphate 3-epimerase
MNKEEIKHIIPAVLVKSYSELLDQLDLVSSIVSYVQIDVVDGVFAPNKTWPYVGDTDMHFSKIVRQEEGMPYWDDLDFEIDLMVANPKDVIDQWIAIGASRIIIHKKSVDKGSLMDIAKNIKEKGVEFFVAVEPEEDPDMSKEYLSDVFDAKLLDGIQCMGIEKIGFQSQHFSPKSLNLIKSLRKIYPSLIITVDGGVNFDNAKVLIDHGANRLTSGSLIFTSDMPRDTIEHLEEACRDIEL